MEKTNVKTAVLPAISWTMACALFLMSCQKAIQPSPNESSPQLLQEAKANAQKPNENKKIGHFTQVNLTANNNEYVAPNLDPTLVNAWGLVFNPNGTPWISSQGGHVSNVY